MKRLIIIILAILCLLGFVGCQANDLNEPMYVPNLYPNTNNMGSIGSPSQYWADGYFTNINGSPYVANPILADLNEKAATYPTLPLSASCVLEGYKSISNNFIDLSGNSNQGTMIDTTWVQLPSGLCVNVFNGTTGKIVVTGTAPTLQISGNLTLSCWAYVTDFKTHTTAITKLSAWSQGYWFELLPSGLKFAWADSVLGGVDTYVACTNNTSIWYMFTVVKSGKNFYFYQNGAYLGTTSTTGGTILTGNTDMQIGGNQASHGGDFYSGMIGLPIVENRALSAQEISDIYNQEKGLFP